MVNLPVSKTSKIEIVQNCHHTTVSVVCTMRICTKLDVEEVNGI